MPERVDPTDVAGMAEHNKCDDCCLVIGCNVCGPCPEHDFPGVDDWRHSA